MKKYRGFTLAEAFITMVILAAIALFTIPQLLLETNKQKNWDTLAQKMAGYATQASMEILALDASLDDFTRIKFKDTTFSIEDVDAAPKLSKVFQKYLMDISLNVDLTHEYFTQEMLDYNKNPIGITLKDAYTGFFHVNDGMLMGFRVYGGCNNSELNANPPLAREKYQVDEICGSIFFDINSHSKPNRLGADQYILPIGKRGLEYDI